MTRQGKNKRAHVISTSHTRARATPEHRKQVALRLLWDPFWVPSEKITAGFPVSRWSPGHCAAFFFSPCAAQQGPLLVVAKALENLKFIVGVHWPSASAAFLHFSHPARPQHRNYLSSRWTRSNFLLNELRKHIVHPKYLARTVQCMYIKTISNFRTQKEMLALAAVQKEL